MRAISAANHSLCAARGLPYWKMCHRIGCRGGRGIACGVVGAAHFRLLYPSIKPFANSSRNDLNNVYLVHVGGL